MNNKGFTEASILLPSDQHSVQASDDVFVDLGSGWPDLVLAHDTGKVQILRNINGKFENVEISDKITPYGFWMGIAVGDYNNDGNLDFFFTNVGDTLPLTETGGIRGKPDQGGIIKGQNITNKHLM